MIGLLISVALITTALCMGGPWAALSVASTAYLWTRM